MWQKLTSINRKVVYLHCLKLLASTYLAGPQETTERSSNLITAYDEMPRATISSRELLRLEGKQSSETDPFALSSLPALFTPAPMNVSSENFNQHEIAVDVSCDTTTSTRPDSCRRQKPFNGRQDHFDMAPFYPQPIYPESATPPQTPLRSMKYRQLDRPRQHFGLGSPPQTPLRSVKRFQCSTPRRYTVLDSPLRTPSTPTKRHRSNIPGRSTAIHSLSQKALVYTGSRCLATPENHSSSVTRSQMPLGLPSLGHANIPFHQSESVASPQTPSNFAKHNAHLTTSRRKPSVDALQPSELAKDYKSDELADGLGSEKLPRVVEFVNLTPNDSVKIMSGVTPSGSSKKQQCESVSNRSFEIKQSRSKGSWI